VFIMSDATGPSNPPSKEQLKAAFKAFKKRLKVTLLDEQSKLNRNPMTTGHGAQILAITPPREFPAEVWDELVRQGKLRKAERGLYELVPE
jgi:hypothetical protein